VKQELLKFKLACESLGIKVNSQQLERFATYQKELSRWNKKINLISRSSDSPGQIFKHMLDSLLIFKAVELPAGAEILDFGSGAGFPGMPINIIREDVSVTLLESKKKKSIFLEEMLKILNLKKAKVVRGRAEDLAGSFEFNGRYDVVTAKAVGKLVNVASAILPFLKAGGLLVAYKGKYSKDETEEFGAPEKFEVQEEANFEVPEYNLTRRLILIKKTD
jgi:16S rRNA (guanine527-N7)-methyltransferase